ncbi:hypothetical protein [Endozoicomonas sp. GU-1]|uniref:hypothetical protein n=2 Tax=Endozoicomonas sp. GU-1 TaxID=3009078 RepID=UPI0022B59D39|nr:hypothetical protein [Endozoicomonas sp. GU-1]WBA83716.1 hypothetical protein O2T12_11665 [Endozoicomonas sp. GU-1]
MSVYDIEVLTPDVSSDSLLKDMLEVTEYTSGECRPWNSGSKNVNDEPSSIPHTNSIQPFLTGTEPEIEKPMPAHYSNTGYQLTDLPAILSDPQDLPADAVVNPLNQYQTTSDNQCTPAEALTDANASIVACQSVCRKPCQSESRKDPTYMQQLRKRQREWVRERRKDPVYAERQREQARERRKDPVYAERLRKRAREWARERRKDPVYAERQRERAREWARERRKDPAHVERQRELARKREKERRKDPAYAERARKWAKEWAREYRKDPANVERQRKRRIDLARDRRNRVSILMHLRKRQEALESKLQKDS